VPGCCGVDAGRLDVVWLEVGFVAGVGVAGAGYDVVGEVVPDDAGVAALPIPVERYGGCA
jgi:hypothetical protein